jgi:cystathionine beta-lyase/cystathionine gamma-synthase
VINGLKEQDKIERLIFPMDETFSQFELAQKQMTGACGLLTVVLQAPLRKSIVDFCESLNHIMMAVSWGGHESLVIPKCAGIDPADFDAENEEHRYVRLYVGLEDPEYLLRDILQALDKI